MTGNMLLLYPRGASKMRFAPDGELCYDILDWYTNRDKKIGEPKGMTEGGNATMAMP